MRNNLQHLFTLSFLMTLFSFQLNAQYADQITVTATGTDGFTSCCGATPTADGFSSSKRIFSRTLGVPQASDAVTPTASYNFYSLGFGGEVVVRMGNGFNNITGVDLQIHETSFGVSTACSGTNPDKVRIWISQDNCNYILMGDFCEQGPNPILLSLPSYLPWARFVKLKDITTNPNTSATATQDGFDLDGLKSLSARTIAPAAGDSINAATVISFTQGLNKVGGALSSSVSAPSRALGAPQHDDLPTAPINYVSLGFGGILTLEMEKLVFKRAAGLEIRIIETSSIVSCFSNPEKANIFGSLNGITWVSLGTVCMNGEVSIPVSTSLLTGSGLYAIRYIRITDISSTTSFTSSTSNGYDVDGVIGITCPTAAKLAAQEEELNAELEESENEDIVIFPNPTNGNFTIKVTPLNENGIIKIFNISGAIIKEYKQLGEENVNVSIEEFPAGLYLVSYQDGERQFINRIVKN